MDTDKFVSNAVMTDLMMAFIMSNALNVKRRLITIAVMSLSQGVCND
jgi:ABC-type uncharacterized transport system ATPase component